MHHMADPGAGAARGSAPRCVPAALLVITELDSFPRFLAGQPVRPSRTAATPRWPQRRAEAGMHMGEDWGARLEPRPASRREAERRFDIACAHRCPAYAPPLRPAVVATHAPGAEDRLSADDLAALDTLLAGVLDRDDLTVRAARTVLVGRRPSSMD